MLNSMHAFEAEQDVITETKRGESELCFLLRHVHNSFELDCACSSYPERTYYENS